MTALAVIVALLLDWLLGEPKRFHPLVGFGNLAKQLERLLIRPHQKYNILRGLIAWCLLVVPAVLLLNFLQVNLDNGLFVFLLNAYALYFAIGMRSLMIHVDDILSALKEGDIREARKKVGYIVSRNTDNLNEERLCAATTESILENGSDGVFAALFWFVVLGAPGVILYRLSNTLDAMWGYKNDRYESFGKVAAIHDDGLNYIPARLVAFSYCLCGNFTQGIRCWFSQAKEVESPNAGPVMCAGAGAIRVRLGGAAVYHGKVIYKPVMGDGPCANIESILRAKKLIQQTLLLWLFVIVSTSNIFKFYFTGSWGI